MNNNIIVDQSVTTSKIVQPNRGGRFLFSVEYIDYARTDMDFVESQFNLMAANRPDEDEHTQYKYFFEVVNLINRDWAYRRISFFPLFDVNWKLIIEYSEKHQFKQLYNELISDRDKIMKFFKTHRESKRFFFEKDIYDYDYEESRNPPEDIADPRVLYGRYFSYDPNNPPIVNDRILLKCRINYISTYLNACVLNRQEEHDFYDLIAPFLDFEEGNNEVLHPKTRINWKRIEKETKDGNPSVLHDGLIPELERLKKLVKENEFHRPLPKEKAPVVENKKDNEANSNK